MSWKNKILYHYTNYHAMEGILKGGNLWLCNVMAMNDKTEMLHFMNLLKEAVADGTPKKNIGHINHLFESQLARLNKQPVFSASFSQLEDDAAQWERYGDRGRGVCIVFEKEYI